MDENTMSKAGGAATGASKSDETPMESGASGAAGCAGDHQRASGRPDDASDHGLARVHDLLRDRRDHRLPHHVSLVPAGALGTKPRPTAGAPPDMRLGHGSRRS